MKGSMCPGPVLAVHLQLDLDLPGLPLAVQWQSLVGASSQSLIYASAKLPFADGLWKKTAWKQNLNCEPEVCEVENTSVDPHSDWSTPVEAGEWNRILEELANLKTSDEEQDSEHMELELSSETMEVEEPGAEPGQMKVDSNLLSFTFLKAKQTTIALDLKTFF
uniref:Uncharacterized protein n=1 Tax=Romanomermis culicivorax TaxID=13658 RepID=A0A915KLN0_ROMCU